MPLETLFVLTATQESLGQGKGPKGFTHQKEGGLRPSPAASVVFREHQPALQQGRLLQDLCSQPQHTHYGVFLCSGWFQTASRSIGTPVDTQQCLEQSLQCCGAGGLGTNNDTDITFINLETFVRGSPAHIAPHPLLGTQEW